MQLPSGRMFLSKGEQMVLIPVCGMIRMRQPVFES